MPESRNAVSLRKVYMRDDMRRPVEAHHAKAAPLSRLADLFSVKAAKPFAIESVGGPPDQRGLANAGCSGDQQNLFFVLGKYGVDVEVLDNAAALLRPDPKARVYLVDEIGKMECLSERFVTAMRALISSGKPTVATIGARGGGFMAEVKRWPECELWEATHDNRDDLPVRILAWLAEKI
jgi:hypothetical protein